MMLLYLSLLLLLLRPRAARYMHNVAVPSLLRGADVSVQANLLDLLSGHCGDGDGPEDDVEPALGGVYAAEDGDVGGRQGSPTSLHQPGETYGRQSGDVDERVAKEGRVVSGRPQRDGAHALRRV